MGSILKCVGDYLIQIDDFAFDSYDNGDAVYVRVARRDDLHYVTVVRIELENHWYVFVQSTMPADMITEFMSILEYNVDFFVSCVRN